MKSLCGRFGTSLGVLREIVSCGLSEQTCGNGESAAHTGVIGIRVGCRRINKGGTAEFSVPGRERRPGVFVYFML